MMIQNRTDQIVGMAYKRRMKICLLMAATTVLSLFYVFNKYTIVQSATSIHDAGNSNNLPDNMRIERRTLYRSSGEDLANTLFLDAAEDEGGGSADLKGFTPGLASLYRGQLIDCVDIKPTTSIESLPRLMLQWGRSTRQHCIGQHKLFTTFYRVHSREGSIHVPAPLRNKMLLWFGNNTALVKQAHKQTVIFIYNKLVSEGAIINPLRAMRPGSPKGGLSEHQYAHKLSNESQTTCDFCNYTRFTAYDTFGRIESKHTVTAANVLKLDKWHGLVIFRQHNPITWNLEIFKDCMEVSKQWYMKAYAQSASYPYRFMTWDLLPSSGGSQIHPHVHTYLMPTMYGHMNRWYRAAHTYKLKHPGRNYFDDLITTHRCLHLVAEHGNAVALVYMTPSKMNEIVVISQEAGENFTELVYYVLRAYIDRLDTPTFSMAMTLPALHGPHQHMPAIARMTSRKSNQVIKSDITSMELFASANIDVDYISLARTLRQFLKKQNQ